jgi:hypothetical protein
MTSDTLYRALAFAAVGWPVFPCQPGQKTPATAHGYLDATTDPEQITRWFTRRPEANLAVATGAPGPDVLDVDQHGPAGNGYAAFGRLRRTGLLDGATAYVATPSGGLHAYFTGTTQRNGHLPACHLDFRSRGGYILAPPSHVGGKPYELIKTTGNHGDLEWATVTRVLEPQRRHQLDPQPQPAQEADVERLAAWVARQQQGNRNAGLYWAAHRALDTNQAADLSPLATAARQAGLNDREIHRTLDSARRTREAPPFQPGRQAAAAARQATTADHQAEAAI